ERVNKCKGTVRKRNGRNHVSAGIQNSTKMVCGHSQSYSAAPQWEHSKLRIGEPERQIDLFTGSRVQPHDVTSATVQYPDCTVGCDANVYHIAKFARPAPLPSHSPESVTHRVVRLNTRVVAVVQHDLSVGACQDSRLSQR